MYRRAATEEARDQIAVRLMKRVASDQRYLGLVHSSYFRAQTAEPLGGLEEETLVLGLLPRTVPVVPIPTGEYPSRARRPAYGVLDSSAAWALLGITPAHWRINLRRMLSELHSG